MSQHKQVQLEEFNQLNPLSHSHGAVLFGSTFAAKMHLTELAQDFSLSMPVYNRSVAEASVFDADAMLAACVFNLAPDQVFVNLGEQDLDFKDHTFEEIIMQYEWILYQIHAHDKKCRIYVMSLFSTHTNAPMFNEALKKLAHNAGCHFVDIASMSQERQEVQAFGIMKHFLRTKALRFGDAMSIAPDYI